MLNRLTWFIALLGSGLLTAGNCVLLLVAIILFKTLGKEQAGQGFGAILSIWTEYVAWPLVIVCATALSLKFLVRLIKGHTNWFIALLVLAALLVGVQWHSANLVREATTIKNEIRKYEGQQSRSGENSEGAYSLDSQSEPDHLFALRESFNQLHKDSELFFQILTGIALLISLLSTVNIIFGSGKKDEMDMIEGGNGSAKGKRDATVFS